MSSALCKLINLNLKWAPSCIAVRQGHHLRGKPPGVARNLEQRLQEINYKDPTLYYKVDIGLPNLAPKKQSTERIEIMKANRKNKQLEFEARNKLLKIDLNQIKETWLTTDGPGHIKRIAEHYGVFEHLYGDAFFYPRVPLKVFYENGENAIPVYYGNVVKPNEASKLPEIEFESEEGTFWTLLMTNPDGHFTKQDKEYVHWFVGNIPGNKVANGETIVEYMQPIPPKGTGYHRHIFVLYKQEKKLDFSSFKQSGKCLNLEDRTFSTLDFYRERQDDLTPAGLAFFQADWDKTLMDFYHNVLDMKEPIFEYNFPETYVRKQEWFPLKQAFNLYMDRHRDPKQVQKEFLIRKLKDVHPFKAPPKELAYPNAVPYTSYMPMWLKTEERKYRNKQGRIHNV